MSESVGPQGHRQPLANQDQSSALRSRNFTIPSHLANSVPTTAPLHHGTPIFPGLAVGPPTNFPTDQHPGPQQQPQPQNQSSTHNQNQSQTQQQPTQQQQQPRQPQHQHQQPLQQAQPSRQHSQARITHSQPPQPMDISQRKGPHATSSIVRMVTVGPCVQQLVKYNHEQRRAHRMKNCVESFWKPFVDTFFTKDATILLDFENTQNSTIALPVEAMPLILKSKHDAGLVDERLFMESPNEFNLENGLVVVDCPKTTMMATFKESKVCTDGHLRVSFSSERKITLWEFTTQRHEELFVRDSFERSVERGLPDSVCTPYGIPKSSVLLYTIAQSVHDMKDAVENKMKQMANSSSAAPPAPTGPIPANGIPNGVGSAPSVPKDNAQKDAGNIITQLNETQSSMMPEKPKLSDTHTSQLTNMQADFSMGLGRVTSNNQFDLDQTTGSAANPSVPPMDPSHSAQLQLAQFQSQQQQQQQQLQSQFNFQHSMRAMQSQTNPDMMFENALRNSSAATAGAPSSQVQGSATASDALWPRGMLFDSADKTPVTVSQAPAPPGLMMFQPNNQPAVSAPIQSRAPNETDPSPASNTMIGEALRDSMNFDGNLSLDIFNPLGAANGVGDSGKRGLAASSGAHSQGNGASKNKRRRVGPQSSGML